MFYDMPPSFPFARQLGWLTLLAALAMVPALQAESVSGEIGDGIALFLPDGLSPGALNTVLR